jgi:hypothetical protein
MGDLGETLVWLLGRRRQKRIPGENAGTSWAFQRRRDGSLAIQGCNRGCKRVSWPRSCDCLGGRGGDDGPAVETLAADAAVFEAGAEHQGDDETRF